MASIFDVLSRLKFAPNARITISTRPPRRKPKEGDIKVLKKGTMVRRQQYSMRDRAYVCGPRGPRWEWVPEAEYKRGRFAPRTGDTVRKKGGDPGRERVVYVGDYLPDGVHFTGYMRHSKDPEDRKPEKHTQEYDYREWEPDRF